MADTADELKKKVGDLKERIKKLETNPKDPDLRAIRKRLKRAQRRLALIAPPSLEEQIKRTTKFQEIIGKTISDMTQGKKRVDADPYVHSLRKKTKSLNKRLKRLNRRLEKNKPKEGATPVPPASGETEKK